MDIYEHTAEQLASRVDAALDTQSRSGLPQGVFFSEIHPSPVTRLYVADYMTRRAESGRPLSHVFVEMSVDHQELLDRFMRREPGADTELGSLVNSYTFSDGFIEMLTAARDNNVRIVAVDLPERDTRVDIRLAQSNPHWRDVVRREMASYPDGQFLMVGGEGHSGGMRDMLQIPSFLVTDVSGADLIHTLRVNSLRNPDQVTDLNFQEFSVVPNISLAQIEGAMDSANIFNVGRNEWIAIVPNIINYEYFNREALLRSNGFRDSAPLSADLNVYYRLNRILHDAELNPASGAVLANIIDVLSRPGQASDDAYESENIANQIDRLADIGDLTPLDKRNLEQLADSIRER